MAGDPTKRALEGMRTLDSFVRRSGSDAHSSRPYLLRVAAVYGRPPLEVKVIRQKLFSPVEKQPPFWLRWVADFLWGDFLLC